MKNICNPKLFSLTLFLSLFSLGQLQRIQLNQQIAFYLHDVFLFLWLIWSIPAFRNEWKNLVLEKYYYFISQKRTWTTLVLVIFIWHVIILIVNLFSGIATISNLLYLARLGTYLASAISLSFIIKTGQDRRRLRIALVVSAMVVTFFGLIQYWFLPDTRVLAILGWDDHYNRLIGTFFDPAFTGLIIVMGFFFWQSLEKVITEKFGQLFFLFSPIIFIIAILLTYSRASYLAFAVGLSVYFLISMMKNIGTKIINYRNYLKIIIYLLVFLLALPFLPKPQGEGVQLARTSTIVSRWQNTSQYLQHISPLQWFVGQGIFGFQKTSSDTSQKQTSNESQPASMAKHAAFPDNLLVLLISTFGLPLAIIIALYAQKKFSYLLTGDEWLLATIYAVLTHSQFSNSLLQPFVLIFLMMGIVSSRGKAG
ncbi:MAG: O-antigen ligase family protein [Patescibacteria group bacterium]